MVAPYADCYKYKRIAGRLSGMSGPVGNRITNDPHDATIRSSDGNVNKFSVAAQGAQMYAAEKKREHSPHGQCKCSDQNARDDYGDCSQYQYTHYKQECQ